MPGIAQPTTLPTGADCCHLSSGQKVVYMGKVGGGPKFGERGVVRAILRHKAIVDMGRSGTWHIPYHFLALPQAA